jgi:hypothetical protein
MNDIFVSFPFDGQFESLFEIVQRSAARHNLNAVRIDQASPLAIPVADSIHRRIRESRLIIADLTGNNPNVLNEIGIAQAFGKPLVLITRGNPGEAPFNVRNLQIRKYDENRPVELREIVDWAISTISSDNERLRAMLVPSTLGQPTRDSWFVIAASPLSWRRARGGGGGYKTLRRTSSDYVGVRGILQSFGLLFGFDAIPDNLDPEDCEDGVIKEPMNIYCIASPKANRWTKLILDEFHRDGWSPHIEFRADPTSKSLRNVRVSIFSDGAELRPAGWNIEAEYDRYARDFGIIVRGPNPYDDHQMVAVLAGRSSLGTEAACAAFTDPICVEKISLQLAGMKTSIENHKQPFWAMVRMERDMSNPKEEAKKDTLSVVRVDTFTRR